MTAYIGQLLLVPYNFAPVGWLLCQGQLVSIADYQVLFELIGTTYGGDGVTFFSLPDLRGRTPIGMGQAQTGSSYVQGQVGGQEVVTLTSGQMPTHTHPLLGSGTAGNSQHVGNALLGDGQSMYSSAPGTAVMSSGAVSQAGGNQPHENRQPYLTLNWIIAYEGVFPSQN